MALIFIVVVLIGLTAWTNRGALGRAIDGWRLSSMTGVAEARVDAGSVTVVTRGNATADDLRAVIDALREHDSPTMIVRDVRVTQLDDVEDSAAAAGLLVRVREIPVAASLSFAQETPCIELECETGCWDELRAASDALIPDAPDILLGADLVRVHVAEFDPRPVLDVLIAHEDEIERANILLRDSEGMRSISVELVPDAGAEAIEQELMAAQEWDEFRVG